MNISDFVFQGWCKSLYSTYFVSSVNLLVHFLYLKWSPRDIESRFLLFCDLRIVHWYSLLDLSWLFQIRTMFNPTKKRKKNWNGFTLVILQFQWYKNRCSNKIPIQLSFCVPKVPRLQEHGNLEKSSFKRGQLWYGLTCPRNFYLFLSFSPFCPPIYHFERVYPGINWRSWIRDQPWP